MSVSSSVDQQQQSQDPLDKAKRAKWNVGSFCVVYSRSANKWYNGKITDIMHDNYNDGNEWLVVKYKNGKKTKKIQRYCNDVKVVPNNNKLSLDIGSKCLIYSTIGNKWVVGDIMSIFDDNDGEWLTVQFIEENQTKICDIQRFSNELKVFNKDYMDTKPQATATATATVTATGTATDALDYIYYSINKTVKEQNIYNAKNNSNGYKIDLDNLSEIILKW